MTDVIDKLSEVTANQRELLAKQENFQKILDKHVVILERQGETLLRNTITVEEHHRRSIYLEGRQEKLENDVQNLKKSIDTSGGIRTFVKDGIISAGYLFTALAAILGMLWGGYKFLKGLGV